MSKLEIGCCGAYCATCKPYLTGACGGCKIGYREGKRDIRKARCKIKVCCINRGHVSCADCEDFPTCGIVRDFYEKKGYKYQKYRQATEYIIRNGYEKFIALADHWKNAYGKYE